MSQDGPSRRGVLQGVAGAGALGIGVSGLSVSAAAFDGTGDTVTLLNKREKMRLARDLADTTAFQQLERRADSLDYKVSITPGAVHAGRTDAKQFHREVVSFELRGVPGTTRAGIILSRDPDAGRLVTATLDVERYDKRGMLSELERHVVTDGGVSTADEGISKQTVEPNEQAVDRLLDDLSSDGASTQGFLPDIPDVLDVSTCDGCHYVADQVCKKLCNRFGSYACSLLGLSVVGAVGCAVLVKGICWVVERYTSCDEDLAATVCESSGLGVCPDYRAGEPVVDIPYF